MSHEYKITIYITCDREPSNEELVLATEVAAEQIVVALKNAGPEEGIASIAKREDDPKKKGPVQ